MIVLQEISNGVADLRIPYMNPVCVKTKSRKVVDIIIDRLLM